MADTNKGQNDTYSNNDTLDINELTALSEEDISPEFIEQLQNQVSKKAGKFNNESSVDESNDATLFEEVPTEKTIEEPQHEVVNEVQPADSEINNEPSPEENLEPNSEQDPESKHMINIDETIDDNFIKKYKARLEKERNGNSSEEEEDFNLRERTVKQPIKVEHEQPQSEIANLSSGNIVEKPVTAEQTKYNESLDFLDNNVKYAKYVIYVDPENVEFIESLTVKERKNLINRILREQDDISLTKRRFTAFQTILRHIIVAILTVALFLPIAYMAINASLEATIDNQRRSKTLFQTLYKEHGKIKSPGQN